MNYDNQLTWYFDYISPFAYLQSKEIQTLPHSINVLYQPVLFAGLLNKWGQLGPAEIETKRLFTYRHTTWLAQQRGIPLLYPNAHPFNSLPMLRATLAAGNSASFVHAAFDWIWAQGNLPGDTQAFADFLDSQELAPEALTTDAVKQAVREATEKAADHGVFGIPSSRINNELFWGTDAFPMLEDYLAHPELFESKAMVRLNSLPSAASRPGSRVPAS